MRDGRRPALLGLRPFLRREARSAAEVTCRCVGPGLLSGIGQREGQVQEERPKLVEVRRRIDAEVVRGRLGVKLLRVRALATALVVEDRLVVGGGVGEDGLLGIVARQHGGELVRGVAQFQQAHPLIHALALRQARRAVTAERPLANDTRVVARAAEQLRDGCVLAAQGHRVAVRAVVGPDACVPGVLAGEQRPARSGTARAARIRLGEAHAFGRQPVKVRRGEFLLPVAAQVPPAQVIGENEDDVGQRLVRRPAQAGGGSPGRSQQQAGGAEARPCRAFPRLV